MLQNFLIVWGALGIVAAAVCLLFGYLEIRTAMTWPQRLTGCVVTILLLALCWLIFSLPLSLATSILI